MKFFHPINYWVTSLTTAIVVDHLAVVTHPGEGWRHDGAGDGGVVLLGDDDRQCRGQLHQLDLDVEENRLHLAPAESRAGTEEMLYLTTHSTHFIYGYMASDIWLRTIEIVRERKPAAATWATLSDYQQGLFYMHHPTDRMTHTTAFVTPVVEYWLEREIAPVLEGDKQK